MAKNFNLTVYQITINIRREKDKREVLSDFASGNDFFTYVKELLESWKYTIKKEGQSVPDEVPLIQQDKENERVFRIMKHEKMDHLYSNGRYISGIIESGDYGTEENIVDIFTGESSHTKKTTESVLFPFYFLFYLPENSKFGFLILERIGNNGVYSLLDKKLKEFIVPKISDDCVLKIRPLVIKKLVEQHLKFMTGGARKIIFEKVIKDDLKVSRLSDGNVSDDEVENIEVVYCAKRNHPFNITKWFNEITRPDNSTFYVVDDIQYTDVSFEISVNGSNRKVSINDIEKLGTYMDITDNVELAKNKYPTLKSIEREAHFLVSYIKEQFKNENDSMQREIQEK